MLDKKAILSFIKEDILNKNKKIKISVHGSSMLPFLRSGDNVIIKRVKENELKVADIVVFKYFDKIVVHRIIKINTDTIICRGDSTINNDEPVGKKNIIGVVIGRERGLKNKVKVVKIHRITNLFYLIFSNFFRIKLKRWVK